jgi:sugar phosphate permease
MFAAMSSAQPNEAGLASGIVNTTYQIGSALGLAAMTAVATSKGAGEIGNPIALVDGFSAAFVGAAGIAVVGAAVAALFLRAPKPVATDATVEPVPVAA